MPKLPKGFGATLRRLYREGYDRREAFKEAWRIHGHSRQLARDAKAFNQRKDRELRSIKKLHGKHNPKRKPRKTCPQCGTSLKGSARVCPHCITKQNPTYYYVKFYDGGTSRSFATKRAASLFLRRSKQLGKVMSQTFGKQKANPKKRRHNPIAIYNPRKKIKNPYAHMGLNANPAKSAKLLYGKARIPKIYGMKTQGEFKGQKFVHTSNHDVSIFGLPNGDLLIKGHNMRLWANDQDVDRYEKR